jgi:hypothetical protein
LACTTILGITALLVVGCAGAEDGGEDAPALQPDYAGLPQYERRCEQLDLRGGLARVFYEASSEMERGNSDLVRASLTLNQSVPADEVLRSPDVAEEEAVVVSCRIQARLTASEYEFEIDETDWVERSLLTNDTVHWSWNVTPKLGGTHSLVLNVRPIMTTQEADGTAGLLASAQSSNVQQYETDVHVKVPWNERPTEFMTRLASTFEVAEGLVVALTGLIVALGALLAALGIKKRRDQRAAA